eukprot:6072975-Amphidinium_carterae.1
MVVTNRTQNTPKPDNIVLCLHFALCQADIPLYHTQNRIEPHTPPPPATDDDDDDDDDRDCPPSKPKYTQASTYAFALCQHIPHSMADIPWQGPIGQSAGIGHKCL